MGLGPLLKQKHDSRVLTGRGASLHLCTDGLWVLFLHDLSLQQFSAEVTALIGQPVLSVLCDTAVSLLLGLAKIPVAALNSAGPRLFFDVAVWAK